MCSLMHESYEQIKIIWSQVRKAINNILCLRGHYYTGNKVYLSTLKRCDVGNINEIFSNPLNIPLCCKKQKISGKNAAGVVLRRSWDTLSKDSFSTGNRC